MAGLIFLIAQVPAQRTFMTADNLAMFWGFVKWFLIIAAPILFIWIALQMVGWIVYIVRGAYGVDEDQDDRMRRTENARERRNRDY